MKPWPLVLTIIVAAACGDATYQPPSYLERLYELHTVDGVTVTVRGQDLNGVGVAPRCPTTQPDCGVYVRSAEIAFDSHNDTSFDGDSLLHYREAYQPAPGAVDSVLALALPYHLRPPLLHDSVVKVLTITRQAPLSLGVDTGFISLDDSTITLYAWRGPARHEYVFRYFITDCVCPDEAFSRKGRVQ